MHSSLSYRTGIRFLVLALMGSLATNSAFSQDDAGESDIVEMSPFEVSAQSVRGYYASESTTGTRIASNIQELPIAVNVVTSEFMDDFQAYDLEEQFAYTSSFVADGEVAQYYLRGFRASFQLRNGFRRTGLFSKVTTDRAEVIKGPVAAIYGQTQPGGVVNYVTKRPTEERKQSIRFSVGTDDHKRFALNTSGAIVPGKLRYRVDTSYRYEEIPQGGPQTPFTEHWVISGVLEYQVARNTRITFEADRTERRDGRAMMVPLLYQDLSPAETRAGGKRHLGLAYDVVDLGLNNIPGTEVQREVSSANLMLEHRFNQVWNVRLAVDYSERHFSDLQMYQFVPRVLVRDRQGNETYELIAREPRHITNDEELTGAAADLLANFWTGKIEHKFLVTFDYFRSVQDVSDWRLTNNNAPGLTERNMDINNPLFLWVSPKPRDQGLDPTRPANDPGPYHHHNENRIRFSTGGAFASWRAAYFDGRLIQLAGIRREYTRYDRFYTVRASDLSLDVPTYNTYATTIQTGLTFKMTPEHYLFVNYSESYDSNRAVDLQGNTLPDEEGSGVDIGIKSSLRDGNLNFTMTFFSIDRKNVQFAIDQFDEDRGIYRTASAAAGLVKSEGFEIDFNFRFLDSQRWTIFGGYGYNDTEVRDAGRDLDLVGRRWERVPLNMLRIGTSYSFRGTALDGLVLTGGFRWESRTIFANGSAERLESDSPQNERSGNDGRREIWEPARKLVDLGVMYQIRGQGSIRHILQLNVKNVLDFDKPTNGGRIQNPRRFIAQYRVDF